MNSGEPNRQSHGRQMIGSLLAAVVIVVVVVVLVTAKIGPGPDSRELRERRELLEERQELREERREEQQDRDGSGSG